MIIDFPFIALEAVKIYVIYCALNRLLNILENVSENWMKRR